MLFNELLENEYPSNNLFIPIFLTIEDVENTEKKNTYAQSQAKFKKKLLKLLDRIILKLFN